MIGEIEEQMNSLCAVSTYLEVLQWMINVGLLPEYPLSSYPRMDELEHTSAPYPVDYLIEYYNERLILQLICFLPLRFM